MIMQIVFQLIVSSFEGLSDDSSRSYNRRKAILETVAKVRSCVVMLDLECDALILEMFQHFLKAIRYSVFYSLSSFTSGCIPLLVNYLGRNPLLLSLGNALCNVMYFFWVLRSQSFCD